MAAAGFEAAQIPSGRAGRACVWGGLGLACALHAARDLVLDGVPVAEAARRKGLAALFLSDEAARVVA